MADFAREQQEVISINNSISLHNFKGLDPARSEQLRRESLLRKLESVHEGTFNLMPDLEWLATAALPDIRAVLSPRAQPSVISNHPDALQAFFAKDDCATNVDSERVA